MVVVIHGRLLGRRKSGCIFRGFGHGKLQRGRMIGNLGKECTTVVGILGQ